jgi:ribosomal protein S18 acetylase RimI-like enzyme
MFFGAMTGMGFDEISLRACTLEDAAALATVGAATFLESFVGILEGDSIVMHCQKQHSVETYRKYLARPEARTWLAVIQPGSAPIGYAMVTTPDLPLADLNGDDIELKRIYLLSRFQGKGVAQRMLDQSVNFARESGKRRLLLGVYAGNARALAFYRKSGFEQVGKRTFNVGTMVCDDLILGMAI